MKSIPIIVYESTDTRVLYRLDRLEGDEHIDRVAHIFNPYGEPVWHWGDGYWNAMGRDSYNPAPDTWAYYFRFTDGSTGVCMVRHVNEALAAVNARVDLNPPESAL
jgi:hypothetical protein